MERLFKLYLLFLILAVLLVLCGCASTPQDNDPPPTIRYSYPEVPLP